jgi:hypothetical protein
MAYAEGTTVPVERSRSEIEKILKKAGATGFGYWDDDEHNVNILACKLEHYQLVFRVYTPDPVDYRNNGKTGRSRRTRTPKQAEDFAEKELKRRWRAQCLIIKAKLEVIESGQSSIAREFLADMMLPSGQTIGEEVIPRLEKAAKGGKMPKLLPALGSGS